MILIKAVENSNGAKFLSQDLVLFNQIIKDLFPNVDINKINDSLVLEAIDQIYSNNKQVKNDKNFFNKTGFSKIF